MKLFTNPYYTFNNFIIDQRNKPQVNLIKEILKKKIKTKGIFIWGRVGVGKTHILHAIANELKEKYVWPSRYFLEVYTEYARKKDVFYLKRKFIQQSKIFMLDDFQELLKIESSFELIHSLYEEMEWLIITSDREMREYMPFLTPALFSRLSTLISVNLFPPGFEGKKKFIEKYLSTQGIFLSQKIINSIAQKAENMRVLRAIIEELLLYAPPDDETALYYIEIISKKFTPSPTFKEMIKKREQVVEELWKKNLSVKEIAERLNLSRMGVYKILKRLNLK